MQSCFLTIFFSFSDIRNGLLDLPLQVDWKINLKIIYNSYLPTLFIFCDFTYFPFYYLNIRILVSLLYNLYLWPKKLRVKYTYMNLYVNHYFFSTFWPSHDHVVQRGKRRRRRAASKSNIWPCLQWKNKAKFFEKKTPQLSYVLQKNQTILKNWNNFWRKMFLAKELTIWNEMFISINIT